MEMLAFLSVFWDLNIKVLMVCDITSNRVNAEYEIFDFESYTNIKKYFFLMETIQSKIS